ncbi:hypothetical protein HPB48_004440 [Haemaphysalis longicornis]|uniref:Uncharacterized protein n=1 Tax=Haemaphysalis longicornis TaxID=44386 RepID=A0A9J6GVZ9_HAELO|nr:hypothetical protein HPB48_004440 [Haemaphysalis longicornis]
MASATSCAIAEEAHQSSNGGSEDEEMETRDNQDASPHSEEDDTTTAPWILVAGRANRRRDQRLVTARQQLAETPEKPAIRKSRPTARTPRQPPLPAGDRKLAFRPRNGLRLARDCPSRAGGYSTGSRNSRRPAGSPSSGLRYSPRCKGYGNPDYPGLQATIEQAIQRSLQQHLPVLQQDIATQQQNFAGYIEERFARLEERLFALKDRHLRRLQKATTTEPTDLHMHQELPPDYDEDDCSPTDA